MHIYTLITPGTYHPLNCEDHIFNKYIGDRYLVAAVMDGCSSGVQSQFASLLYGKSLNKACLMLSDRKQVAADFDFVTISKESLGQFILGQLFEDVKRVKKGLFLSTEEILSTILLLVYDLNDNTAWINISGDGLLAYNGEISEFDQQNRPDYLAYHLDITFDQWLGNHTTTHDYQDVRDISISTDGLQKLRKNPQRSSIDIDPVDLFLIQKPQGSQERALLNSYLSLTEEEKYIPYDDIGIVRMIPEQASG
jgi:hypothetical protein